MIYFRKFQIGGISFSSTKRFKRSGYQPVEAILVLPTSPYGTKNLLKHLQIRTNKGKGKCSVIQWMLKDFIPLSHGN